tara:strand:+ start:26 stop:460 length:435 start_codon:yes stop_codon:yes gene_type:complete
MSNKKDTFKKGFILEGPNNVVIERLEGKNKKKKYLLKISHPLYSLPAITRMSSAQLKHKRAPEYAMDIVKKKQPQIVTKKKAGRFTATTKRAMTKMEVAKQKANKSKTKKSKTKSKGGGRTRRRKGKQRRKGTKKKRKRKRKSL